VEDVSLKWYYLSRRFGLRPKRINTRWDRVSSNNDLWIAQPDATLNQMSTMLKDINESLEITAIHQRINQSGVEFLQKMLSEALDLSSTKQIDESIPKLLEHFH
jgi:hypothetical protein